MKYSILDLYLFAERIKNKRETIQRRLPFDEPVLGLSISRVVKNDSIQRTDTYTDTSDDISEVSDISEDIANNFNKAGYFNLSDIKYTDIRTIGKEVDVPWTGIKEIKKISTQNTRFTFDSSETKYESVSDKTVMSQFMNNRLWVMLFLFEYAIRDKVKKLINALIRSFENPSQKRIIENMYQSESKAKKYITKITEFVSCSEQYAKDVINGRIESDLTPSERDDIMDRDNNKCQRCGSTENLEVHHIIPVSQGGGKDDSNFCTLCSDCHFNHAHGGSTSNITYETKGEFWEQVVNSVPEN